MLKYVAEEIASITMRVTGYPIIITDKKAVIIGADKDNIDRLNDIHEASVEVMASGMKKKHGPAECRKLRGTYPGITMPIAIHDEVVGSIGIRGDSEEVEKYGMLVKMVAEIMLKDRIEAESAHIRHSNLQMLATMIITYNGDEIAKSAIINQGILLGFNLTKPRIPIIVSKSKSAKEGDATRDMYSTKVYRAIKRQFHDRQDIIVVIDAAYEKYLIFAAVEREIGKLTDEVLTAKCKGMQNEILESEKELIHIALSKASSSVSELKASYERAEMLLATTLSGSTDKSIVRIIDVPLERMLIEAAEYYKGKRLERRIKGILNDKNAELFEELIITWCESMFNFAETARRLGIHKNTLTYRFEKIKENCSIDLHDFKSTISIYLCLRICRLKRRK